MTIETPAPGTGRRTVPPPFDPELAAALGVISETFPPTFTIEMLPMLRAALTEMHLPDEALRRDGRFDVTERSVPGPEGAPPVSLLICRPVGAPAASGVLYYLHGGGMIMGDNRPYNLAEAQDWAEELRLTVVSADYRLAPEHPYPAPVEDCYAGLVWLAEHAAELGADPDRIVVAGPSAGGLYAAATALLARDRNGPRLAGQMLLSPALDDRNDTVSARQMAGLGIWDRASNEMGWTAYLGSRRADADVPAYAAPARATDLTRLPPAFIDVGSTETFRDEAVTYASRLWQAGGEAELHVWPGGFHTFGDLVPAAALSQAAKAQRLPWLRRTLGARP
jgi:acetyl esterase/lipase